MMQDRKTKQSANLFLAEVRRCRNEARNYKKRKDRFMAKKVNVAAQGEGITSTLASTTDSLGCPQTRTGI